VYVFVDRFWLLAIVLFILLKDSDYPFGIFKLFKKPGVNSGAPEG
jgi:hypothetical protein